VEGDQGGGGWARYVLFDQEIITVAICCIMIFCGRVKLEKKSYENVFYVEQKCILRLVHMSVRCYGWTSSHIFGTIKSCTTTRNNFSIGEKSLIDGTLLQSRIRVSCRVMLSTSRKLFSALHRFGTCSTEILWRNHVPKD
jgi:hypothetical protein